MGPGDKEASSFTHEVPGLRILHVMRSPVGGLFRHVADLARAQARAGHSVGVVADSLTGGEAAAQVFARLAPHLALGVARFPMRRLPHPDDLHIAWRVADVLRKTAPDIVHGHGAKGGLYARLPALIPLLPSPPRRPCRVYTPHGGSLHFRRQTIQGGIFFTAERIMSAVTDVIPFECDFARRRFLETIGRPRALTTVVYNGLSHSEFEPLTPVADAAEFLFVGEMRVEKGVGDLLRAFATLPGGPRLTLVGAGRDQSAFRTLAAELGLDGRISFVDRMPTREAFRLGRILVTPSRAESFPYIVLEAIAAHMPVIACDVGGVPEIFGEDAHLLVAPNTPDALAAVMRETLHLDPLARAARSERLAARARALFTLDKMSEGVLQAYRTALAAARPATH